MIAMSRSYQLHQQHIARHGDEPEAEAGVWMACRGQQGGGMTDTDNTYVRGLSSSVWGTTKRSDQIRGGGGSK